MFKRPTRIPRFPSRPSIHSKVCWKRRSKALRKFREGKRICIRCMPQYASLIQLSFSSLIKTCKVSFLSFFFFPFFPRVINLELIESIIFVCSRTKNKYCWKYKMNESTLYNIIRYKYRNGKEDVSFIFQFDHLDRVVSPFPQKFWKIKMLFKISKKL